MAAWGLATFSVAAAGPVSSAAACRRGPPHRVLVCAHARGGRGKNIPAHVIDMSGERMCRICLCVMPCHYLGFVREGVLLAVGQSRAGKTRGRHGAGVRVVRQLPRASKPCRAPRRPASRPCFWGLRVGPFLGPVFGPGIGGQKCEGRLCVFFNPAWMSKVWMVSKAMQFWGCGVRWEEGFAYAFMTGEGGMFPFT